MTGAHLVHSSFAFGSPFPKNEVVYAVEEQIRPLQNHDALRNFNLSAVLKCPFSHRIRSRSAMNFLFLHIHHAFVSKR